MVREHVGMEMFYNSKNLHDNTLMSCVLYYTPNCYVKLCLLSGPRNLFSWWYLISRLSAWFAAPPHLLPALSSSYTPPAGTDICIMNVVHFQMASQLGARHCGLSQKFSFICVSAVFHSNRTVQIMLNPYKKT